MAAPTNDPCPKIAAPADPSHSLVASADPLHLLVAHRRPCRSLAAPADPRHSLPHVFRTSAGFPSLLKKRGESWKEARCWMSGRVDGTGGWDEWMGRVEGTSTRGGGGGVGGRAKGRGGGGGGSAVGCCRARAAIILAWVKLSNAASIFIDTKLQGAHKYPVMLAASLATFPGSLSAWPP